MSRNVVIGTVVVAAVILLGWYYLQSQKGTGPLQATPSPQVSEPITSPATDSAQTTPASENLVRITSSGFSPENISVKASQDVVWMNENTIDHTVNSAIHPTHLIYPPLNLGVIKPGEKKTLNFPTAGTYKYHDHLNTTLTGSVTVE